MFAQFARTFLQGLIALLPVIITLYLLGLLAWWLETTVGSLLTLFLADPEQVQQARDEGEPVPFFRYVPGMGLLLAVILIFLFGLLLKAYLVKRIYRLIENQMQRVPIVKSIYGATKDFLAYFSSQQQMNQVVLVNIPNTDKKILGLVTRESFDDMPPDMGGPNHIAVYMPMSYQIGGYTLIMPREQVEPIDLSIEDGLRFALTAGISERKGGSLLEDQDQPPPPNQSSDTSANEPRP